MRFLNLKINNVFSFKHAEISLDNKNLCLVTGHSFDEGGSNGAGKSSLINHSLIWGLFGVSPDGVRGDDVINKNTGMDNAWVEIEFECGGDIFWIVRHRNPSSLKLAVATVEGWDDLSRRLENETQDLIETIIGRNFSSFVHADFFGQGDKVIPFPSMTPSAQREMLEDILPIRQIDEWAGRAEEARKEIKEKIEEHEGLANMAESMAQENRTSLYRLIASDADWRSNRSFEIDRIKKEIEEVERNVQDVEDNKSTAQKQLDKLGQEENVRVLEESISVLGHDEDTRINRIDYLTKEENKWRETLASLQAQDYPIKENTCPTCHQEVNQETTDRLKEELEQIRYKIDEAKGKIGHHQAEIGRMKESKEETSKLKHLRKHELTMVQQRNSQRAQYKSKLEALDKFKNVSSDPLKRQLHILESEGSPFKEGIDASNERIDILDSQKTRHESFVEELKKDLAPVELWEGAFKRGIKNALFQKACGFLNNKVKSHLEKLNNPQFHVEFSTTKELKNKETREELNVQCWSDTGGKSFSLLSSGERQIVSFAIGMALSDLALTQVESECNLMVLDEPFVCLDPRNCENIVNYLTSELSKSRSSIFLISNEDSLKALIPNHISVVKENGVSRMEE